MSMRCRMQMAIAAATATASGQLAAMLVQLADVQPSTTGAAATITMAMVMAEVNSSEHNRLIKKRFGNAALFLMIVRHLQTGYSLDSAVLLPRQLYIDLLRNVWHNVPQEENQPKN